MLDLSSVTDYDPLIYIPNKSFIPDHCDPELEFTLNKFLINPQLSYTPYSFQYNLNHFQRNLLKEMKKNKILKRVETDKNLGPALMTHEQYQQFCLHHLNQNEIYEKIDHIPLEEIKWKVQSFYDQLIQSFPHERKNARIIISSLHTSEASYFHGIPKIHKTPFGCRPIISNVNSPTQGLSKWLTFKLKPDLQRMQSYMKGLK
jgi:hypothetical protein